MMKNMRPRRGPYDEMESGPRNHAMVACMDPLSNIMVGIVPSPHDASTFVCILLETPKPCSND